MHNVSPKTGNSQFFVSFCTFAFNLNIIATNAHKDNIGLPINPKTAFLRFTKKIIIQNFGFSIA